MENKWDTGSRDQNPILNRWNRVRGARTILGSSKTHGSLIGKVRRKGSGSMPSTALLGYMVVIQRELIS